MATKTEYEVDESINAYVKDEETLNQMQKDGQLKPFSNYFTPDEDINLDCLRTKVLWTNPNPNASFSAQTVNLLSNDWDYLIITSQNSDTHVRTTSVIFSRSSPSSVGATLTYTSSSSSYGPLNYVRHCNIVSWNGNPSTSYSQVYFENCYEGYNSTEVMDNRSCIPNQIIGIYKSPAMIYTGTELYEGNGIEIKDGVVSSKSGLLVVDYTVTSDTSSITINGLDLVADGGVYDIVFAGGSVNGDLYLQTNSVTSGYYYSGFRFHIGSMTRRVYYGASEFLIGESSYNGVITMQASNNTVYIDVHSSVVRSGDYGNFINNGFAPVQNITSIKIYATTIYAGTNFKIYKRASNSPIRR